jgi:hypothetical protein
MRILKIIAVASMALPAIAGAQVGPNPAVSGGSQDPTIGASTDSVTAPQDAQIGTQPRGNVLDRQVGGTTDGTISDGGAAASSNAATASTTQMPTSDPQATSATTPKKRTRR